MRIVLEGVAVQGRRDPMLAPTTLAWSTGEALLVAAEPGHGHTALALVATGRLVPTAGDVRLEADPGELSEAGAGRPAATLRELAAVVDVPGVSEPVGALPLHALVAEDLALAGRPSGRSAVRDWLAEHDLVRDADARVDQLAPLTRTRALVALAGERRDLRFLVLTLPDRHGGRAAGWWEVARQAADAGYGVLVQCGRASARLLGADLPPDVAPDPRREPPVVALRYRAPAAPRPEPEPAVEQTLDLEREPAPEPADEGRDR